MAYTYLPRGGETVTLNQERQKIQEACNQIPANLAPERRFKWRETSKTAIGIGLVIFGDKLVETSPTEKGMFIGGGITGIGIGLIGVAGARADLTREALIGIRQKLRVFTGQDQTRQK